MSFTDDENKRIEDEESRAAEEIRAKFRSMFSDEEKKAGDSALKDNGSQIDGQKRRTSVSATSNGGSDRVVKKVVVDDVPPVASGRVKRVTTAPVEANPKERRPAGSATKKSAEKKASGAPKNRTAKTKPAEAAKTKTTKVKPVNTKAEQNIKTKPVEARKTRPAVESEKETVRIKGPGYSLSGHKILTDSNYDGEFNSRQNKSKRVKKEPEVVSSERKTTAKNVRVKEEEPSLPAGARVKVVPPVYYVARGIQAFRQDIIPKATNELTQRSVINNTRKVKARARRVERAGQKGTVEPPQKAQISVFSPEFRTEYQIDYGDRDSIYSDHVVATGKVNPNTARISKDTINRMLEESEKETGKRPIADAGKIRSVSPRKTTSKKHPQSQLRSVDNSKKKQKQRLRQNKPKGPGGKIALVILLVLFLALCVVGFREAQVIFDDSAMNPDDLSKVEYTVTEGTTDDAVAEFLVSHGMVESTMLYRLRAKIFDAKYVPGTYELSPSYSTEKIINILSGFDYSSGS